jgi:beta-glucosidase
MSKVKLKFPKGFLWGAAGSSYQTEGNNTNSDWWVWEQSQKRADALKKQGKNPEDYMSGIACDSYNRYDEDFALAQHLNHNAIRIGVEWSRIEPREGVFDEAVLGHYEKMLQSAKFHGLAVFLTLHHYTNPIWFARKGGFSKKQNIPFFVDYAHHVVDRLGQYVDFWITINEPELYATQSFGVGVHPPQVKSIIAPILVVNNLIESHKQVRAFIRIHSEKPVSMAFNLLDFQPSGFLGELAVRFVRYIANGYIMRSTVRYCDYIGVNYYFHHHIGLLGIRKHSHTNHNTTDRGWGIHPEGLERVLVSLKKYKKPLYILENGLADAKDHLREKYIKDHLYFAHKAIERGADVRGYLYWSLIDNFEWEEGFAPRFGLIEIDREDLLRRKVRFSATKYAEICKNNSFDYEVSSTKY